MDMHGDGKIKTYFELLAERESLDRELMQARAREAEAVLKDIAEKMWLFAFTPRDVEKAYRKHELLYSNPKVFPDRRIRRAEPLFSADAAADGGQRNEE
ncbi:hypothetical protein [Herbaspirillum huttiense]|uniref:hypothetical protein n=1 Tax=Herbaspirillum huttiense TaxID=863372 RepID=UPI0031CDC92F